MGIVKQSGPTFRVTTLNNGDILEIGPASTSFVGTIAVEFLPSPDWVGQFVVTGKILGEAARIAGSTFKPLPYRLGNKANFAAGWEMVSDAISDSAMISIPAPGFSIGFLCACSAGYMDVCVYRMDGNSAV